MSDTHITEGHCRAFEALTSGRFDNFCLLSCFVNGKRTAASVAVNVSPPLNTAVNGKFSSARSSSAQPKR